MVISWGIKKGDDKSWWSKILDMIAENWYLITVIFYSNDSGHHMNRTHDLSS